MSFKDFTSRLMQRFGKRDPQADLPQLCLGAFGKYPGERDHMQDLGLETPTLIAFKQELRQAIENNVGDWLDGARPKSLAARLQKGEAGVLIPWHHLLLQVWPDRVVLARLWPSSDAAGRDTYPFVLVLELRQVNLHWITHALADFTATLETRLRPIATQADMAAAVTAARDEARRLLAASAPARSGQPTTGAIAPLATLPAFGPDQVGFWRIHYQCETDLPELRDMAQTSTTRSACLLRVPAIGPAVSESLLPWLALLLAEGAVTPITLLAALDQQWLDLLIGEAGVNSYYCLRAGQAAVPFTSAIPFTGINADLIARAQALLAIAAKDPAHALYDDHGPTPGLLGADSKAPGFATAVINRVANKI